MSSYTSLERVKAALNHKEADRIPFDLGGSLLTGIHRVPYEKLRSYLGLKPVAYNPVEPRHGLAEVDDDLAQAWGIDVGWVKPLVPAGTGVVTLDGDQYNLVDEWGIKWLMPVGGAHYMMRSHPMANIETVEELEKYPFPDPCHPDRFVGMAERAVEIMKVQKRAYILGRACSGTMEMGLYLRGFENFYTDMLTNRGFAEALLDKILEFKMKYWEKALATVGKNVMTVIECDDLGDQKGLLISPKLYRDLIKPRHKLLFDFIREKAQNDVQIILHCCGAIKPLIPDLIEIGVNALHPVQISAAGMEPLELKKNFGKDITFWGGGMDTQNVLPFGNVRQVKDEVRRRIEDFAAGGGFVFATVHNIDSDIPPENIVAMWEALQEYGKY